MIVSMHKRGKSGWSDYVQHGTKQKPRDTEKVKVLDGADLSIGDAMSDGVGYERFVISFKGRIPEEVREAAVREWRDLFMYGYAPDEYQMDLVYHSDTDDDHYHGRVPAVNLLTGTKLDFYFQKTDLHRKDLIQQYIDLKYGLESPESHKKVIKEERDFHIDRWREEHGQELRFGKKKEREKSKALIGEYLTELHSSGFIDSLDDVKSALKSIEGANLKIANEGHDRTRDVHYVTIQNETGKLKLTGDVYNAGFFEATRTDREDQIRTNKSSPELRNRSSRSLEQLKKELDRANEKRASRLEKRIGNSRRRAREQEQEAFTNFDCDNARSNDDHRGTHVSADHIDELGEKTNEENRLGIEALERSVEARKSADSASTDLQGADRRVREADIRIRETVHNISRDLSAIAGGVAEVKENVMNHSIQLSISPDKSLGLNNWKTKVIQKFSDLVQTLKNGSYSAAIFRPSSTRSKKNIEGISNVAIFDIDNDPGTPQLSLVDAEKKLKASGFSALIITSKSHKKTKTTKSGKEKPPVDRFRVVVPLKDVIHDSIENDDVYRQYMHLVGDKIGLTEYADMSAFHDRSRFYYPSPEDAQTITVNTGKVLENVELLEQAHEHIRTLEEAKAQAIRDREERRKNRAVSRQMQTAPQSSGNEYLHIVHAERLEELDMRDVIAEYEGAGTEKKEGSYVRFKVPGGGNYSVLHDGNVVYDWKTMQSYNVHSYFEEHETDGDYMTRMKAIENRFDLKLIEPNIERISDVVREGLKESKNEGKDELEKYVKNAFKGVNYVKFDMKAEMLTVTGVTLKFSDIGQSREQMVKMFTENRHRKRGIEIDINRE